MARPQLIIYACLFLSFPLSAQQYSFQHINANGDYALNNDGNQLYCLFRVAKTKEKSLYRKVFLDEQLKAFDSVQYEISGDAVLINSGDNGLYTYHVFETKINDISVFYFIITNKTGATQYEYSKTSDAFAPYFGRTIKIKNIALRFLSDDRNSNHLLMEASTSLPNMMPAIISWNISEGSPNWHIATPPLRFLQTTDSLLIGMGASATAKSIDPSTFYFIDKYSGRLLHTASIHISRDPRYVVVAACNDKQLMVAGDEYENSSNKKSHFFMTMFDLKGKRIFDKVDSSDRLLKYRRNLMGGVFDHQGNLVLMAQGYKLDATRAIVGTAAGVAIGVLLRGAVIVNTQVDNRVDFITSTVLSPENGAVLQHKMFPVGPWYSFGAFISDGEHVLIGIGNNLLLYNPNEPDTAPEFFSTIASRERLLLTHFGPAISYSKGSKNVVVELLQKGEKRNKKMPEASPSGIAK